MRHRFQYTSPQSGAVSKQVNDVAARLHTWHCLHESPPTQKGVPKNRSSGALPYYYFTCVIYDPGCRNLNCQETEEYNQYQQILHTARGSHGAGVGILASAAFHFANFATLVLAQHPPPPPSFPPSLAFSWEGTNPCSRQNIQNKNCDVMAICRWKPMPRAGIQVATSTFYVKMPCTGVPSGN